MANKIGILLCVIALSLCWISAASSECDSIGQPKDFQISLYQDTALLAQWTADDNHDDCNVTYSYSIFENDVLTQEGDTRYTQFLAIWGGPCTNTVALLYAKIGNEITSIPAVASWHTCPHPGGVTNLTITPIRNELSVDVLVQWAPPTGFEGCIITYKVTIDDNTPIIVDGTEHTIPLLEYCHSTAVSVVPVIDDVEGIAASSVVEISPDWIGPVEELTTTVEENMFIATWVRPPGFVHCSQLFYSFKLRNSLGGINGATSDTKLTHNITNNCPGSDLQFTVSAYIYGVVDGEEMLATQACP